MDLKTYLCQERGRTQKLAARLGVSGSLMTQWARGKPVSVERCPRIESLTAGEVRRWDLRPNDWWQIWPELIGAEGAPTVVEGVA